MHFENKSHINLLHQVYIPVYPNVIKSGIAAGSHNYFYVHLGQQIDEMILCQM